MFICRLEFHPRPGAQYPNFIDEETEALRMKEAYSCHTGINDRTGLWPLRLTSKPRVKQPSRFL